MPSELSHNNKDAVPIVFLLGEAINAEKENMAPSEAWHFYSSSIKKYPNNLALHTHRVFFAMSHKSAIFLPGALYDLFFILKDSGKALRIRLLKASRPYLKKSEVNYLAKWIKSNKKEQMGFQWVAGSVLTKGLISTDTNLVDARQQEESTTQLSALEEAQSCIEYGQLEIAQSILQKALTDKDIDTKTKETLQEELDNLQHYLNKHKEAEDKMLFIDDMTC